MEYWLPVLRRYYDLGESDLSETGTPSFSPVKLGLAKSSWCLAADAVVEVETGWGGTTDTDPEIYVNLPPHRNGGSMFPSGGNEVFADGSAQWFKIAQMRFLTTWSILLESAIFTNRVRTFLLSGQPGGNLLASTKCPIHDSAALTRLP